MVTLHLVQQAHAHQQEDGMSTPEDLALDALAVQARIVAKLRAAKAEGDKAWEHARPETECEPDAPPEPPMSEQCPTCSNPDLGPRYCGTDTCTICGEAIDRHASAWWHCHGARDHMPRPALTWLEIEDRWAEWKDDDD